MTAESTARRFALASPATATVLGALVVVLAAALVPLAALVHHDLLLDGGEAIIAVPFAPVGFIVARRQPGNPIGWLLLAVPVRLLLSTDSGFFGLAVIVLLAIRQTLNWRCSSGERRQQLKWLVTGTVVTALSLILSLLSSGSTTPAVAAVSNALFVGVAALPVSVGVAILKYRLYDIDKIISRTLAYAIVTGLLVGVYTGDTRWRPRRCRSHCPPPSRWPGRPWWRRHCSIRSAGGCSWWWTGGSTGPAMTRT